VARPNNQASEKSTNRKTVEKDAPRLIIPDNLYFSNFSERFAIDLSGNFVDDDSRASIV